MQAEAHPRTLAFSFDGTGNEPADAAGFTRDESISNVLPGIEVDDLLVHPVVHGALHSHSGLMVKVGREAPRRVCVRIDDHPSDDPSDAPIVHHSVGARFTRVSGYRPNALRGLRFRLLLPDGSVSDSPIDGIAGLLENESAGTYSEMS